MRLRLALALTLASTLAHARSQGRVLGYPRDHVWSPAVRFLVVDERAKLIEKDPDTGYVLFEVTHDGKTYRGSLEILTVQGDGRPNIRFAINLVGGALHKEAGMLKRLEQKLRSELGSPPPPPKKQEDKEAPKEPPPKDSKDGNQDAKLPEVQP